MVRRRFEFDLVLGVGQRTILLKVAAFRKTRRTKLGMDVDESVCFSHFVQALCLEHAHKNSTLIIGLSFNIKIFFS